MHFRLNNVNTEYSQWLFVEVYKTPCPGRFVVKPFTDLEVELNQ